MEKFIEYIQESIKTIENMELTEGPSKSLTASRLDSICALLQLTIIQLNNLQNEKS